MKDLRCELVAIFGEVTVLAAERERDTLAKMDDGEWCALVNAHDSLAHAAPEARKTAAAWMDERTRRRLVLALLGGFLCDVAEHFTKQARP